MSKTNKELQEQIRIMKEALETAHENACECCNSQDDVRNHCYEALYQAGVLND